MVPFIISFFFFLHYSALLHEFSDGKRRGNGGVIAFVYNGYIGTYITLLLGFSTSKSARREEITIIACKAYSKNKGVFFYIGACKSRRLFNLYIFWY